MDPKYGAATERLLTIYITYLVTKYAKLIPGLDQSMVPDLVVLASGGGMAAYAWFWNTKQKLIDRAAKAAPSAKIELSPRDPDTPAIAAATPSNVTIAPH